MNYANILTCSRLLFAALFAVFLFWEEPLGKYVALFFFVLASLTDYWDGRIARSLGQISQFGKLMDPIADKVLTLAAFFSFWWLSLVPLRWVVIIVMRDLILTGVRFRLPPESKGRSARASGKQKTFLQIVYILGVLIYLIARESRHWDPAWDGRALMAVQIGMILIVMVTVLSGLQALLMIQKERR